MWVLHILRFKSIAARTTKKKKQRRGKEMQIIRRDRRKLYSLARQEIFVKRTRRLSRLSVGIGIKPTLAILCVC